MRIQDQGQIRFFRLLRRSGVRKDGGWPAYLKGGALVLEMCPLGHGRERAWCDRMLGIYTGVSAG